MYYTEQTLPVRGCHLVDLSIWSSISIGLDGVLLVHYTTTVLTVCTLDNTCPHCRQKKHEYIVCSTPCSVPHRVAMLLLCAYSYTVLVQRRIAPPVASLGRRVSCELVVHSTLLHTR